MYNHRIDQLFFPSLNHGELINEVRRERMVEFALEGFRLNDLKRWAVYEKVINGVLLI